MTDPAARSSAGSPSSASSSTWRTPPSRPGATSSTKGPLLRHACGLPRRLRPSQEPRRLAARGARRARRRARGDGDPVLHRPRDADALALGRPSRPRRLGDGHRARRPRGGLRRPGRLARTVARTANRASGSTASPRPTSIRRSSRPSRARLRGRAPRGDQERELAAGPPRDLARLDSPRWPISRSKEAASAAGPLRGHRAAGHRELLPLHALPEADGDGRLASRSGSFPGRSTILSGEELLRAYEPEDGFPKFFCSACGSALWSSLPDTGEPVGVRMAAFDDDPGVRPAYRQFVAYAAEWEPIPDDGLPRHPERTPPQPLTWRHEPAAPSHSRLPCGAVRARRRHGRGAGFLQRELVLRNARLEPAPRLDPLRPRRLRLRRPPPRRRGPLLWAAGVLWLVFFPNAPYIVTDFKWLRDWTGAPIWFDVVLVAAAAWCGLMLGFISLYLMQAVVRRSIGTVKAWLFVLGVLAVSSFGIYLGRFQRWNSWDVFTQPGHFAHNVVAAHRAAVRPPEDGRGHRPLHRVPRDDLPRLLLVCRARGRGADEALNDAARVARTYVVSARPQPVEVALGVHVREELLVQRDRLARPAHRARRAARARRPRAAARGRAAPTWRRRRAADRSRGLRRLLQASARARSASGVTAGSRPEGRRRRRSRPRGAPRRRRRAAREPRSRRRAAGTATRAGPRPCRWRSGAGMHPRVPATPAPHSVSLPSGASAFTEPKRRLMPPRSRTPVASPTRRNLGQVGGPRAGSRRPRRLLPHSPGGR